MSVKLLITKAGGVNCPQNNGDVAQLGEQLPCTHQVAGSTPVISTIFGRLAQLVRASRLHREGREFESLAAHHITEHSAAW